MTADISLLLSAVQTPDADRTAWLALADALDEAGRGDQAGFVRDHVGHLCVEGGEVVAYRLDMRDECGSDESEWLDGDADGDECDERCREWCREGSWGDDGASVRLRWSLVRLTATGEEEETDTGSCLCEIDPDHDSLIRAACDSGQWERCCGGDPGDHDWTSEGEGGCDENPGVWSLGGTSYHFASHCRACGLHRNEYTCGSQRNPGEHDTVSYEMTDSWCGDCEREECRCAKWSVIDQYPDEDGEPVVYGEGLTRGEAEALVAEIEDADDGREPLLTDE